MNKTFRKSQEPAVQKLKEPALDEITKELVKRWGLNFTRQDVSSLWFLCKQVILSSLCRIIHCHWLEIK